MDILLPQILFQIINFLVVLGLLSYLLYKPILEVFRERSERIEKGQIAAQEAIEQREKIAEYEAKKERETEKKIAAKLEKATADAAQQKIQLTEKARQDVESYVAKQQAKWEQDRAQMLSTMQENLASAVVLATEKIMQKKLTKQEKDSLVSKQLEQALQQM